MLSGNSNPLGLPVCLFYVTSIIEKILGVSGAIQIRDTAAEETWQLSLKM